MMPAPTPGVVAAYSDSSTLAELKTRLYVMLRGPLSMLGRIPKGPLINYADHRLSVRAIKIQADGALHAVALLEPYADEPTTSGLMTTRPEELVHKPRRPRARASRRASTRLATVRTVSFSTRSSGCRARRQARETCACVTSTRRS